MDCLYVHTVICKSGLHSCLGNWGCRTFYGQYLNDYVKLCITLQVTVMIMSLKAASLGLNMVAACHVLLLDLWWNPTTEDQAIDRAHRIGQTRPVTVVRLTVKDTVEDRILALQVYCFPISLEILVLVF